AIAALQCVPFHERALQIGDFVGVGHALDGLHTGAVALHRQHQAAAHHHAIDPHRAGPAHAVFAADMAAGEAELLAQEVDQRLARVDSLTHLFAVDADSDVV